VEKSKRENYCELALGESLFASTPVREGFATDESKRQSSVLNHQYFWNVDSGCFLVLRLSV
jgi:hypothetical protein